MNRLAAPYHNGNRPYFEVNLAVPDRKFLRTLRYVLPYFNVTKSD